MPGFWPLGTLTMIVHVLPAATVSPVSATDPPLTLAVVQLVDPNRLMPFNPVAVEASAMPLSANGFAPGLVMVILSAVEPDVVIGELSNDAETVGGAMTYCEIALDVEPA